MTGAEPVLPPSVLVLPAAIGALGESVLAAATAGWLREHTDAPTSQRAYLRDLAGWLDWCAEHGVDPTAARRPDVAAWLEQLAAEPRPATGRPLAPASRARALAAVSSWYGYLLDLDEDLVDRNPVTVRRPTVSRHRSATVGLTEAQARDLLAAADADPYPAAVRTRALIRLLLETGLRVAEACALDVAGYGHNRGHRTLRYTAKGGQTMERAVHPDTAAALDAYLADRAADTCIPLDQLTGPLLVTSTGRRIDQPYVFRLVRRLARAAGIPGWRKVSPRTRCATPSPPSTSTAAATPATSKTPWVTPALPPPAATTATGRTSTVTPPTPSVPPSPAARPSTIRTQRLCRSSPNCGW
ncbi:Integrase family protein (modular protein) [Parafrankia sp. Ea1.12]|nr:tyrosine-type recombinase/integrase [Parafrankia sp. Ea1.12]SQD96700.1 Integrase family protein (modular protein) [Parafrankia sp. Ea1.12]